MIDYQQLYEKIIQDPRYLENLDWGKPRKGHEEGTIRAHIADLERNLNALNPRLNEGEYWRLRTLIHTHDTFKPHALKGVPITHPQSHGSLARTYLAEWGADEEMLNIVQFHDEPYALWLSAHKGKGLVNAGRFQQLLELIKNWDLFVAFLIVDACTDSKSREPLQWFLIEIEGKVQSRFGRADILD